MHIRFIAIVVLFGPGVCPAADSGSIRFRAHVIEDKIPGGYQVVVANLNHDNRPDVIGLSGRATELFWYENPGWEKRVLVSGMQRMISVAAEDLDGDGIAELALATRFGQTETESEGVLYQVKHQGDPRKPWQAIEFDRVPTSHRLQFGDIDGDGRKELINAPLTGLGAEKPDFDVLTPLFYYRGEDWKRQTIFKALDGVVHGMSLVQFPSVAHEVILTASFGGVWSHVFQSKGKKLWWEHEKLVPGNPQPRPKSGASEIRVGRLGETRFLTTIEPWHGNQVVVYRETPMGFGRRSVIDNSLDDGHTLVTADFDNDGTEEIVAGYRAEGANLYLYSAEDPDGATWRRNTIDVGSMGAAGCTVADLNGDGRVDLVCIGTKSENIKWYENLEAKPQLDR